ncbi:carboxypeptidase family protein [Haloactinopolyspora alba]|uniref:alpha-amylase n=1 Tax=Haloactinopolyspora alba TaxID=648780 RepID=A0A2P8E582_9ACTN|nr:carboxypeptidase regulatory-like domain-containing protein [Haloactinopolyspora alba]PSL04612.1 carboxypeptidase family protein [Haloactinopolyspora alba]
MRLLPVLTSLAVVAGLTVGAPPSSAAPSQPDPNTRTQQDSAADTPAPDEKIEPRLQRSLKTDEADYWIRFADEADLSEARQIDDWAERGRAVYDALRTSATKAQADVVAELDENGVDYESYWVSNAILVQNGSAELATDLALHSTVAEISEAEEFELEEPKVTDTATSADATPEWGVRDINADDVWATGITGEGITVAGLDTGVDGDHASLMDAYRGYDPATGSFDDDYNFLDVADVCPDGAGPCDLDGHGSHTIGTVLGDDGEDNKIGVAPAAEWIAANGCETCSTEDMIASAQWMLAPTRADGSDPDPARRPHVINNSWGSEAPTNEPFMEDIITAWNAAGMFSVWSNGNNGPQCQTSGSPGSRILTYSVGSYGENGEIAPGSSRGPGQDGEIKPNIAAPGVQVRSAWHDGGYNTIGGTSMAAPHVTGAVALLWSAVPALVGDIASTRALLDDTARDVDDTTCGGTADDNPTWGEGKLDALALVNAGIEAGGAGDLTGTVTGPDGEPLTGATISAEGTHARTTTTGEDGTFSLRLLAGDYEVTTTKFGYVSSTTDVTITIDEGTTSDATLEPAERHDVTGTVVTDDGEPVPNADVTVEDTPLSTVHTGDDGTFAIADVPVGDYTIAVKPNACFSPTDVALTVDGAESMTVPVELFVDGGGYSCAVSEGDYRRGTDKVEFSTYGVWGDVDLPFPVAFYDGSFDSLKVGKRGLITPERTAKPGGPERAVFPFYTHRALDLGEGGIYTAATTVDGEDAFVVEYRDVVIEATDNVTEAVINFSVTFTRSGTVIIGYGDGVGADGPLSAGSTATTGIQGPGDVAGIRFSHQAPVLHDGLVVTYDMPDFGYLDATVIDENDGLPVEGAQVSIADDSGVIESLTIDATGAFHRQLPTGDYTMTVSADDYETATYEFSLDELYASTQVEARLTTGITDVTTDGLDAVLGTDQKGAGSLTLTNSGSAPVTFDLAEVGRHPELDDSEVVTRTAEGGQTSIDLERWAADAPDAPDAPDGHAPSDADDGTHKPAGNAAETEDTFGTLAGGDVLARFKPIPDGEGEPTGLGYDGDVWVHDYDSETNTEFTVTGQKTGKEFAAAWNPDFKAFDMALDTLTGDMCQMEDSPASYIHCFDRETGEKTREIKGEWSSIQLTGLAYNADRDVFYVGGRRNGRIGTVAGTSHETPGALLSHCVPPERAVMGLAYNAASDTIWYSDRDNYRSRLWQINPDDCSLVNAWWFPDTKGGQGGGLATDVTGALWAVDQIADEVLLVDVEDDLTTDLPWLSLSATGGTLDPGESMTVDVSLSTQNADPGVLAANILVTSDAGRQSKEYVPVTLTTTEYQVGVNAGGQAFTDGVGFAWSADQAYAEGSWGHQGKTRTMTTDDAVDGTTDDALFQAQRAARGQDTTYVFDDAPEGTYVLDLGFAEIRHAAEGKRVFDVLVNGELTHYAYDAASNVGTAAADVRTTVVEHSGGPLTVELRGSKGMRAPSIASLRVTLDPRGAAETPDPEPEPEEPEEVPVVPAGRSYEMEVTTGLYREGTTRTGWAGSFGCGVLWFEFDFPFYDTTWDGVCVSPTGMLTFDRSRTNANNKDLPTRGADAIYPFWDYLHIDDEGGIYIGTTEVDGLDAQVIEYRDVTFDDAPEQRVSFSVTLVADGRIQIGYGDGVGGEHPLTKGASATVGIENLAGDSIVHSFDEPVLTAGTGLEFTLPASGMIEGAVTDANDGEPVADATVTLTTADGDTRTATTNEQGLWKAQMLLGEHTVEVSSPGYVATTETVTFTERGQSETLDTELATGVAEVSGDNLDWLLGPDQTATAEMTVTNTGSAPLDVTVAEHQRSDGDGPGEPADLPWLSLTGDAVAGEIELSVGESTTVTATADTSAVEPGLFTGAVLVSSNAGRTPDQPVPARLGSSAYWVGVNAGGPSLTGTDGFVWSADQALANGSWGHVDGTADSTSADIAGTEDDDLFRTQRTGRTFSYVFEDAPAGRYVIGLGFAEIANVKAGERPFDVLVNGEVVLYDHDVQTEAGALAADTHTVTVEHTGGDLTVELIGENGERDPILSTLKVLEDPRPGT